jgi:hypothetical protein
METVVYMPLLNEGTDCWRPVRATQTAEDVFEITDLPETGEQWVLATGSRVHGRNHVFAQGETGLLAFELALESNSFYQLLKNHQGEVFRMAFSNGEEVIARVLHVDQYEDFFYELVSTSSERSHNQKEKGSAYAGRFADLVSARLEE